VEVSWNFVVLMSCVGMSFFILWFSLDLLNAEGSRRRLQMQC